MFCLKSKNHKMGFVMLFLLLLVLLLLSTTTPCKAAAGNKVRFERFKGGSYASEFKSSKFHGPGFQGNSEDKEGDQVFGADKRKVYTGPNPLHNR
ncbi:hypothetical protein VNO77_16980 [Canavalia gladiata]|uniref:Uncharacterized protein n=1 Tax=Canavalia gladiata TaxID=3824 RepID=A0AAN9QIB2_CANGL